MNQQRWCVYLAFFICFLSIFTEEDKNINFLEKIRQIIQKVVRDPRTLRYRRQLKNKKSFTKKKIKKQVMKKLATPFIRRPEHSIIEIKYNKEILRTPDSNIQKNDSQQVLNVTSEQVDNTINRILRSNPSLSLFNINKIKSQLSHLKTLAKNDKEKDYTNLQTNYSNKILEDILLWYVETANVARQFWIIFEKMFIHNNERFLYLKEIICSGQIYPGAKDKDIFLIDLYKKSNNLVNITHLFSPLFLIFPDNKSLLYYIETLNEKHLEVNLKKSLCYNVSILNNLMINHLRVKDFDKLYDNFYKCLNSYHKNTSIEIPACNYLKAAVTHLTRFAHKWFKMANIIYKKLIIPQVFKMCVEKKLCNDIGITSDTKHISGISTFDTMKILLYHMTKKSQITDAINTTEKLTRNFKNIFFFLSNYATTFEQFVVSVKDKCATEIGELKNTLQEYKQIFGSFKEKITTTETEVDRIKQLKLTAEKELEKNESNSMKHLDIFLNLFEEIEPFWQSLYNEYSRTKNSFIKKMGQIVKKQDTNLFCNVAIFDGLLSNIDLEINLTDFLENTLGGEKEIEKYYPFIIYYKLGRLDLIGPTLCTACSVEIPQPDNKIAGGKDFIITILTQPRYIEYLAILDFISYKYYMDLKVDKCTHGVIRQIPEIFKCLLKKDENIHKCFVSIYGKDKTNAIKVIDNFFKQYSELKIFDMDKIVDDIHREVNGKKISSVLTETFGKCCENPDDTCCSQARCNKINLAKLNIDEVYKLCPAGSDLPECDKITDCKLCYKEEAPTICMFGTCTPIGNPTKTLKCSDKCNPSTKCETILPIIKEIFESFQINKEPKNFCSRGIDILKTTISNSREEIRKQMKCEEILTLSLTTHREKVKKILENKLWEFFKEDIKKIDINNISCSN